MKPLASYLDAYRAERLKGVEEAQARTHTFARISRERLVTKVSWGDLKARMNAIEDEIAEEIAETPDPAA